MSKEVGAEEISAQLDQAIAEETTTDSPPVETGDNKSTETVETAQPEGKGKSQAVPYTRFKEVNDAKNEYQARVEELETQFKDQADNLSKLTNMLEDAKGDADLVNQIRALANDPNMLPHIQALDNRIRGVEEEVEEDTGPSTPEKELEKTRQTLRREQESLQEQLVEQKETLLLQRADSIADKWLEALPEEYTEQDRQIIGRLWADSVDWNSVTPDNLNDTLNTSFQDTINAFGTPRGGLINPEDPDSYTIETPEPETVTPEQELMDIVGGKNWGAYKSENGKFEPEVSDDDFARGLAEAMKTANKT